MILDAYSRFELAIHIFQNIFVLKSIRTSSVRHLFTVWATFFSSAQTLEPDTSCGWALVVVGHEGDFWGPKQNKKQKIKLKMWRFCNSHWKLELDIQTKVTLIFLSILHICIIFLDKTFGFILEADSFPCFMFAVLNHCFPFPL